MTQETETKTDPIDKPPLRLVDPDGNDIEIDLSSEGYEHPELGKCDDHVVIDTPLKIDGKLAGHVQTWISVSGPDLSLRVDYKPDPERHPDGHSEQPHDAPTGDSQ